MIKKASICNNVSNGIGGTRRPKNTETCTPGNNRVIQDISPDHNPFIITDGADLTKHTRAQVIHSDIVATQNANLMSMAQKSYVAAPVTTIKDTTVDLVSTDAASSGPETLTTVITILLIIAILFLLLAVIIVTKNSFNKPVQYQGVEQSTLNTERA